MAQRLKRWESPRKEGRNDKGKGGSARQRQLKKRTQMLRQKLKEQGKDGNKSQGTQNKSKKGGWLLTAMATCVGEAIFPAKANFPPLARQLSKAPFTWLESK